MRWRVEYSTDAEDDLLSLDKPIRERIRAFVNSIPDFPTGPRMKGAPMKENLAGLWRYRVGEYRVLCRIMDDVLLVLVVRIGHRREIYRRG